MKISLKQSILLLVGVIILAGFLRLFKLGEQSFIADEFIGVNIAYGYQQTGEWKLWDFNSESITDEVYTRANIYYWQVAKLFDYFEVNEHNSRLISVAWGMLGIILVFAINYRLFKNPTLALIAALLLAVSVSALMYDRKLRMYAMFAPMYLTLSYLLYNFLETKAQRGLGFLNRLSNTIGFNINYLIPLLLIGFLSLNTHLLTVNIAPTASVYMIVMAIYIYSQERNWKNKYLLFSVLSIITVIIATQLPEEYLGAINLSAFNWSYLQKVTLDYSHELLAFALMAVGAYYLIKIHTQKGLWITLSFLVPLILAIFVWHRNAGHQYIFFVLPFKVMLMAGGIYWVSATIIEKFSFKSAKLAFSAAVIFLLIILFNFKFFLSADSFYEDPLKWSYPNYKQAYAYYIKHRLPSDLLVTRRLTYYYIRGTQSNTLNYGAEDKLTVDKIKQAQTQYNRIWYISSAESYIKGDARKYIEENFEPIEIKYTKNNLGIWRWEK